MGTKAETKEEELTARQTADLKTMTKKYAEIWAIIEEAVNLTSDKYWLDGYKERTEEKNKAFKDVQIVAKQNANDINHKTDLTALDTALKFVKKACDRLDEYRANPVKDVEALQDLIEDNNDHPLFKENLPKTAIYDFATGQVMVKQNK